MREFHRDEHAVANHRRPHSGAESEEEHVPAFVAPERLHRGIVDHANRATERLLEIKSDPTSAQIPRLEPRTVSHHRARVADRHVVVCPVRRGLANLAHHDERRHARPGRNLDRLAAAGREQLDVGSSDIHDESSQGQVPGARR